jgi:glycosyltransferase involved in cell wall biosynthesis
VKPQTKVCGFLFLECSYVVIVMKQRTVKIVLNAMVKNESKIILRMLESAYKYIDYWVIQDNGSTDGTQSIIENFFKEKNIPGVLYFEPWQYPGYNRNHTLQKCAESNHGCEYVLRLDADEILEVDEDFDWEELRRGDEIYVHAESANRDVVLTRPWMWKADIDWEYSLSKRHEVLLRKSRQDWRKYELSKSFRQIMLPGGATWQNPHKYYVDSIELEQQVMKYEPKDRSHLDYNLDAYYVWYLAKSYIDFLEDCRNGKTKLFFGKDHEAEMARRGIFYYKKYLKLAMNIDDDTNFAKCYDHDNLRAFNYVNQMAYVAIVYIGLMHLRYIDVSEGIKYLVKSYEFDPLRNEGLYNLANHFHVTDNEKMVYLYTSLAMKNRNVNVTQHRNFLVESVCYPDTGYSLLDLHSFAAYKLGYYEEAKITCKQMIDNLHLVPEYEHERIKVNYEVFSKLTS